MSYRVYFGRLPDTLVQDDFEKLLEQYGKAKNIEWKAGYAYVDYKHGSDASKTVENLNGKEIGGNNILVELAQIGAGGYSVAGGFSARLNKPLPRPVRTPHRVRIENLSTRAKWMELKELLSLAGEVTFADTHKRKQGEGIVEFANKRDLVEAIKMFDKTLFFGKTIRLYNESPRSMSGSYTRRDSRSRSPPRRRFSPPSKDRKRRSRSKSKSPDRKLSHSERRSESGKKPQSKSASPHRKSQKHKYSKSPSSSPDQRTSSKRREHSKSPNKSSRHSHRKSRKSRKDVDRSRSRSPSRKEKRREKDGVKRKHRKSYSSSNSDNENNLNKKKSKNTGKKQSSSSGSNSDSTLSSNEDSDNDHK